MFKKVTLFVLAILALAVFVYAGGSITGVFAQKNGDLRIDVSVDDVGAYLGCSVYTKSGRIDAPAKFVVGDDIVIIGLPEDAVAYEVALWRKKYDFGKGPDPYNGWAKTNGYYLWDEMDRKKGRAER